MVILYTINCPSCKVLEAKLKQKAINFDIVDDKDKVIEFGKKSGIQSAPILSVDEKALNFTDAIKWVREQ